jgi:uncharacterized glyoxalase superfamily protein PhnB
MAVKPIPDQYHSVQPYLLVEDPSGLIEFIRSTFGAEEMLRMPQPDTAGSGTRNSGSATPSSCSPTRRRPMAAATRCRQP